MTTPVGRSVISARGRTRNSAPTRCSCSGRTVRRRVSESSIQVLRIGPGQVHQEPRDLLAHRVYVLARSEEHTSELQSLAYLVCRLLLEKKKKKKKNNNIKMKLRIIIPRHSSS